MEKQRDHDSRSPGSDVNPGPSKHEAGVLTNQLLRSVETTFSLHLYHMCLKLCSHLLGRNFEQKFAFCIRKKKRQITFYPQSVWI